MIALVLIGPTGSGKSTVAKTVASKLEIPRISSGDIAREVAKVDRNTAIELDRGNWAPELAMRQEVLARIEAAAVTSTGFIIEGFPRRLEQLYILESVPDIRPIYFVLEVGFLTCIRRLIQRGREGDQPDSVAMRINAFQEFTVPLIEALSEYAVWLDAGAPVEELSGVICDHWLFEHV